MRINRNKIVIEGLRTLVLILITHNSVLSTARCAFDDNTWGVRPMGMAGAYTAVSNDANGALFNPAGSCRVQKLEIALGSAKLYTGLDGVDIGQNYFGMVRNFGQKAGAGGITWHSLYTPALYREDIVALTYSRAIMERSWYDLLAGVNVKYMRHEYELDKRTADDPVFSDATSKAGVGADAGLILMLNRIGLSFGITGRNINQPDVGLKTDDKVTAETAFGAAFSQKYNPFLQLENFTFAFDVIKKDGIVYGRSGFETTFFDSRFVVRAGHQQEYVALGLGYKFYVGLYTSVGVDYAFAWPLAVENSNGNHKLGVTVGFLAKPVKMKRVKEYNRIK